MRYLMITSFSRVSTWMSEARRWMALKIVESTSLMIGLLSAVMRSIDSTPSPSWSSCTSSRRNPSVASSSTRWAPSDFSRISSIAERSPILISTGWLSRSSSSSRRVTSVGSATTIDRRPGSCFSGTKP